MSLTVAEKAEIVNEYGRNEQDTGSPEVQVAMLTKRINDLAAHFKQHQHDHHSRQGLLRMVGRRRKHLDYLKANSPDSYRELISSLGLRK